jgi:hypothetical protein
MPAYEKVLTVLETDPTRKFYMYFEGNAPTVEIVEKCGFEVHHQLSTSMQCSLPDNIQQEDIKETLEKAVEELEPTVMDIH